VVQIHGLTRLGPNEPAIDVELIQAIPKGDRWERIIEKGTELGATGFRPIYAERSVRRIPLPRLEEKLRRWTQRAVAAAKQCERARTPPVASPAELGEMLAQIGPAGEGEARLLLAERGPGRPPIPPGSPPRSVLLAVGPEGGWAPAERESFIQEGFQPVRLGPRILRADTAAIAGLTAIQALWGDLAVWAPARS
jgi:16S rRNA (uracil1498-N3)-methyltransferase